MKRVLLLVGLKGAGCVTFRVYCAGAADQPHGTPVFLVSGSGIAALGATDDDGVFILSKAALGSGPIAARPPRFLRPSRGFQR